MSSLSPQKIQKPFLKWAGGKTQLLSNILDKMPRHIQNYHEPFVGGGSVLFGILSSTDISINGTIYASDSNPRLIQTYQCLQSHPNELINTLETLANEHISSNDKEAHFYMVREAYNKNNTNSFEQVAQFIFLNKTCFRGLYREGPNGFNVPYGHYKTIAFPTTDHWLHLHHLLQRVQFECCDFTTAFSRVVNQVTVPQDFVYMDPPYVPETTTSFVKYNKDGFDKNQHTKLFQWIDTSHTHIMLSNAYVPLVTETFKKEKGYITEIVNARRAIHSKNPDRKTQEVIITNY